jgi:hypothetical protein
MPKAKKRVRFLITLMILLSLLQTTASALSITITKTGTYSKNGKFYVNFHMSGNYNTTVSAVLKDTSGNIVVSWPATASDINTKPDIAFGADYTTLPAGQYTMIATATTEGSPTGSGGNPLVATLAVKINNNPKPTLSFVEEGMFVSSSTGQYIHRFNFNFTVGAGKTVTTQIYTWDGLLLRTCKYTLKNASGTYSYKWDYFPDDGLRVDSGDYVIKYKIGDGEWQQIEFTVQF